MRGGLGGVKGLIPPPPVLLPGGGHTISTGLPLDFMILCTLHVRSVLRGSNMSFIGKSLPLLAWYDVSVRFQWGVLVHNW